MSYYTQSVKTHVIDPVFNSANYRSEFRITKEGLFASNMRIHNLGVLGSVNNVIDLVAYNKLTGVVSAINNVFLYDGKEILDQKINLADSFGFTSYNNTNQLNSDVNKFSLRNGMGFVLARPPNPLPDESEPPTPELPSVVSSFYFNAPNEIGITQDPLGEDPSPLGFLDLTKVFPLLSSMPVLDTTIFPNLRVVIEYKKTANALAYPDASFSTTSQPILVIDEILNEGVRKNFLANFSKNPVVWAAQLVETVQLPANKPKSKFRLNAFSNKTVRNLLVQKKGSTNLSNVYKASCSEAQVSESYQVVVNGSNLFPQAIDRPSWRLNLLTETFGNCNSHTSSFGLSTYYPDRVIGTVEKINTVFERPADRFGRLDYFGCNVNKKVNFLDLDYSREVDQPAPAPQLNEPRYNQALTLNVFGTVLKTIVGGPNNTYSVSYL